MNRLTKYVKSLKAHKLLPENIQVTEWRGWTLANAFNQQSSKFISESVAVGIDREPETALFKALTEFCERKLAKGSPDIESKLTERSDGFAAFPVQDGNHQLSKSVAANNAYNEAVERFLWATWWDDVEITYTETDILKSSQIGDLSVLIKEFDLVGIRKISIGHVIESGATLNIFLAENRKGGFITGGAAGKKNEQRVVEDRAFGELLRHLLTLEKMYTNTHLDMSFYEQRLFGFGSGAWRSIVLERLAVNGPKKIELPQLRVDKEISHDFQDVISVHRCLFLDAPVFIGGSLERLCI